MLRLMTMLNSNGKNRIEWIDTAKGYGIIFVFLGHIGFGRFGNWIYSFHLPLFFFLSGYVFKSGLGVTDFIKKKARSMLLPYILLALLFFPFDDTLYNVKLYLIQQRFGAVWFIATLLVLEIIFYILTRAFKKDIYLIISTAVLTGIWIAVKDVHLPWNADAALFASPFFCAGFLSRKYNLSGAVETRKTLICGISLVISIILAFLNVKISGETLDIYIYRYGCIPVMYLAAFAGIAFVTSLSMIKPLPPLEYIGCNSLIYYGIHMPYPMNMALGILAAFGLSNSGTGIRVLLIKALLFVLLLIITTVAVYIWNLLKSAVYGFICRNRRKS